MIKFIALGTSGSFPTKERNHPSFYFEYKGVGMLFDCGEGTQRQMRKAKISPSKVKYLFITHWHGDHSLGIPGFLHYLANSEYKGRLLICGPPKTKEKLVKLLEVYNLELNYEVVEVFEEKTIIDEKEFYVKALPVKHTTKTLAFFFKQKDYWRLDNEKLKTYGLYGKHNLLTKLKESGEIYFKRKKIKVENVGYLKKGFKFTYVTDTCFFEKLIEFSKDSDVLLVESTFFGEPEKAKEYYHLDISHAIEIFEKSSSRIMLVTHISQRYEKESENLKSYLKENCYILNDFDEFRFEKNTIVLRIRNQEVKYKREETTGKITKVF